MSPTAPNEGLRNALKKDLEERLVDIDVAVLQVTERFARIKKLIELNSLAEALELMPQLREAVLEVGLAEASAFESMRRLRSALTEGL